MSNEAMTEDETLVTIEQLLHQRKVAYARWSYGKNWASYRGVEFSLVGGPDEDEIELEGDVFDSIEYLFAYVDTNMGGDDEEGLAEALTSAWDEWMESDEAGRVHVGQQKISGES